MPDYQVKRQIRHGDKDKVNIYQPGETITLPESEAKDLLACGAIEVQPKTKEKSAEK